MQIKTIQKLIRKKLEDWLSSISDDTLRVSVRENLLVSGGSITSMLLNEHVNDYDIYLKDIDVCVRLAKYYTAKFEDIKILDGRLKKTLIDDYNAIYSNNDVNDLAIDHNNSYAISLRNLHENQVKLYFEGAKGGMKVNENADIEKLNYEPLYFSPNAISLSNQIQVVLRFIGNAEQIHKTFDFIHATNYFTFDDGLIRNLEAMESILTKQLKYQGSEYPLTSIIRAKKFIKRGFNISAGELLKIMYQISALNLDNPDVLEEQLIGVDVAYFSTIIAALRNEYKKDNDFKLTTEFFNNLIDKIFNGDEDGE